MDITAKGRNPDERELNNKHTRKKKTDTGPEKGTSKAFYIRVGQ